MGQPPLFCWGNRGKGERCFSLTAHAREVKETVGFGSFAGSSAADDGVTCR